MAHHVAHLLVLRDGGESIVRYCDRAPIDLDEVFDLSVDTAEVCANCNDAIRAESIGVRR